LVVLSKQQGVRMGVKMMKTQAPMTKMQAVKMTMDAAVKKGMQRRQLLE
jgi:hypothetical protein